MTSMAPLRAADAERMASLHASAFPEGQAWHGSEFSKLLCQSHIRGVGYLKGSDLLAFILIQHVTAEAEILTLATHPDQRQQGLARQLIRNLQQELAPQGLTRWLLDVAEDNPGAIAFYEKLGFQIDGRRPQYYKRLEGTRVDAILMSKPVAGQVTP
ncbi:MAG: ribosomal protein S18-alanine N-acetyltransferase [Pseudomonadota bacterium]